MTRPLRVLVNGMSARLGGGESLLIAQMESLSRRDDVELTIYATPSVAERLRVSCHQGTIRAKRIRSLIRRLVWEQVALPQIARKHDVLYMPGNFAVFSTSRPQVVAFQNALHFGQAGVLFVRSVHSLRYRVRAFTERLLARASLRRATAAVVVSDSLGRAVAENGGFPSGPRVVAGAPIPPGQLASELADQDAATLPDAPASYVLAVAHDYPHKDWDGLIDVFLRHRDLPPLLLVGQCRSERRLEDLQETILRAEGAGRVELIGPVLDDVVLDRLYRGAACYVAHSFLEAFPLTPREAIVYGRPVAASDIPAHRELGTATVHFYSPGDGHTLAHAVRAALSEATAPPPSGNSHRTWDDNAKELAAVFREVSR